MEIPYNSLFKWCVHLLIVGGDKLGMTYEEINIWIFCIIEPIVFILMLVWIIYLIVRVKRLKRKLKTEIPI